MTKLKKRGKSLDGKNKLKNKWKRADIPTSLGAEIDLGTAVALAANSIMLAGFRVYQTTEFDEISTRLSAKVQRKLNKVGSPLDNELSSANAFYLCVETDDRAIIGFCSVRAHAVGDEMLSGYLDRYYRRIYGNGEPAINPSELPPPTFTARGTIGFISDLFIAQPQTGSFSAASLMMLAISTCAMRFEPDLIYGFVSDRQVRRGLGAKYLIPGLYPAALHWLIEPPWDPKDWMLCLTREDCEYITRKYPSLLDVSMDRALCGVRNQ